MRRPGGGLAALDEPGVWCDERVFETDPARFWVRIFGKEDDKRACIEDGAGASVSEAPRCFAGRQEYNGVVRIFPQG